MFESKAAKDEAIDIPARVAKKLSLRDGMIVEARIGKGKPLNLGKKNKIRNIMKYAGIWEIEDDDDVFREMRKGWSKWQKSLSA
jgi:antitoxin component of MazEF toxin-antitoxin module